MLVETREREREQQAPTGELGLHPPCFISGETEARGWKVTYRVVQAMHGSAGEKDQFSDFFRPNALCIVSQGLRRKL